MTRTKSTYLALLAVLLSPMAANATLLISSQPTNPGDLTAFRSSGNAVLTWVNVGAANVLISEFGTFGTLQDSGLIKFVIFLPGSGNTPIFSTAAIAATADTSPKWWNSPTINFDLLANTAYLFGLISNQSFGYTFDVTSATAVSAGGLSLPLLNGNTALGSFNNPTLISNAGALVSFRAFGPVQQVPEPGTLALLGIGLFGMGLARRRRKV